MGKNAREGTKGATPTTSLNSLGMLREFNKVLRVECMGESLPPECVLTLAVIRTENEKGNICKRSVIVDQIGKKSQSGRIVLILEKKGLISRNHYHSYTNTINGEIILNSVIINLTRILLNRPTNHTPRPRPRPKPPIETFEQLVKETLNKKGLNQRVKYALLRTLGMKANEAKQAVKAIAPLKNTERIKPVLNGLLSKIITADTPQATQGQ